MIWLTSDLHLGHDKEFIWGSRGFKTVQGMNEAIVNYWNGFISPEDDVYLLGDVILGDRSVKFPKLPPIYWLTQLNGKIHLIRGNHDTDRRLEIFSGKSDIYKISNPFVEICDAKYLKYGKYHFFLTHFPCLTGNIEKESLKQMTLNLHGHTHSKDKFFNDLPYCYNVGVDAHNMRPICFEQIIEDMKKKMEETNENYNNI